MPVRIKEFDEQQGYGDQNQNENFGGGGISGGGDEFIDAGGSGGGSGSSSGGSSTVSVNTTPNLFIFNIKCISFRISAMYWLLCYIHILYSFGKYVRNSFYNSVICYIF